MRWPVLILTIWMTSCAANSGGNECTWVGKFTPDAGFEERWTDGEKRQAIAHNRKVEGFCR